MPSSTSKSSTDAAVLVDPKRDVPRGERDIRLEDYLNDKIQTMADLANLSKIIETVEIQKQQLDQQVSLHSFDTPLC
jgi:hypothetical protein